MAAARIVLADLDAFPDGGLSSLTLLIQHGLDGADDAAAGTVDLSSILYNNDNSEWFHKKCV